MTLTELAPDMPPVIAGTTLPSRHPTADPRVHRTLSGFTADDLVLVLGSFVSAICIALLVFGRITSLSGPVGFVVATFVLFLAVYAALVSLTEERPVVVDRIMTVLLTAAALLAGMALLSVIGYTLWKGKAALTRTNLYVNDMSAAGPADPLSAGGISHAIVGTLVIISFAIAFSVPLGLACAVYLNETRSRARNLVRTIVDAMTALPSILTGLFVFAVWILQLGFERSGLAAGLAVSIMMLPIVIRSSDVVLRLVAGNLREAALALGAPTWRTVWHVVLPTARSGLSTSVILGVARGVGETAPVLLTSGFTAAMNTDPTRGPMISLPLATFEFVRSPQEAMVQRGFATAAVLMVVVLVLFTIARVLGGRPAGQATKRQSRRLAARSARDATRINPAPEATS